MRFFLAVEQGLNRRRRALLAGQNGLEPLLGEAAPHTVDHRGVRIQSLNDPLVWPGLAARPAIRLQQNPGFQKPRRAALALANQRFQLPAFPFPQFDNVNFARHDPLPDRRPVTERISKTFQFN